MTKVQLAETLGVSHSFIHHLLKGRKSINLATLEKIENTLSLENDEYRDLVTALSEDTPGLKSLLSHLEKHNFDEVLVPFALNCFSKLKGVKELKIRGTQSLGCDLWKGFIDLRSPSFYFDLRLFIGIPEPGKVGFHWKMFRPDCRIPENVLFEVPLDLSLKDSRRFQEKIKCGHIKFLKPTRLSQQGQNIYVKEP